MSMPAKVAEATAASCVDVRLNATRTAGSKKDMSIISIESAIHTMPHKAIRR